MIEKDVDSTIRSTLESLVDSLPERGDKTALVALTKKEDAVWSYRELGDRARSFARGLMRAGFRRGDSIALSAETRPEWIVAVLGIIRAGLIAVPLDTQMSNQDLDHVLTDSEPRAILTTGQRLSRFAKHQPRQRARFILLDAGLENELSWQRLLDPETTQLPTLTPQDPALLFYTSGTTGPPKGVPLTHRNIGSQLEAIRDLHIVTDNDRVLLPLPLHHAYALVLGTLAPLFLGLRIILPFSITGPQLLRAVRDYHVTVVVGVPRLYNALYSGIGSQIESHRIARPIFAAALAISTFATASLGPRLGKILFYPLHKRLGEHLRLLACGGAALDPRLASKLEALGWQLVIGYGLTETSPLVSLSVPNESRRGSVGKALPAVELRIDRAAVTETQAVGDLITGEILVRGPNVFSGYHNLPDQTAQAFTTDGWFRTGDIGYLDAADFLYVLGRFSTLIKTESGKKIQTEDLEAAYSVEAAIREIGILGKNGRLTALIVPRQIGDKTEQENAVRLAIQAVSARLPSYQWISEYAITRDALPRTRLGKIQRHLLVRRFEQAKAGESLAEAHPMSIEEMSGDDQALMENAAARSCWELLKRRYSGKRLTPDSSPQFDLGIDSLEWLTLTLELAQSSGVELTEGAISRIETVRDLLREVTEAAEGPAIDPLARPYDILDENQKRWLKSLGPIARLTARSVYAFDRVLMRLFFRLTVEGRENLPENTQWVIIPNHVSYLDPLAIAAVLNWDQLRNSYWAGWTGIFAANPIMRFLSRLGKILPVEPTRAARTGLALGAIVLKNKKNLVWFPEGGRSRSGELEQFKPGIGMLLARFPSAAVPVFIEGSREAWPVAQHFPRLAPIHVIIGQARSSDELMREGEGTQPHERIVNALHMEVTTLAQRRLRQKSCNCSQNSPS